MTKEYDEFKGDILREVKLKEVINKRHQDYEEVLRKELIMAKNIIKNPVMLKKANVDMNFDRMKVYKFKDIDHEFQGKNGTNNPITIQPIFVKNNSNTGFTSRRSLSINEKLSPRTNMSGFKDLKPLKGIEPLNRFYNNTPQNMTLSSNFIKKKKHHFLSSHLECANQSIEYKHSNIFTLE